MALYVIYRFMSPLVSAVNWSVDAIEPLSVGGRIGIVILPGDAFIDSYYVDEAIVSMGLLQAVCSKPEYP